MLLDNKSISWFSEIIVADDCSKKENLSFLRATTHFFGFREVYEIKYCDWLSSYVERKQDIPSTPYCSAKFALRCAAWATIVIPIIMGVGLVIYRAVNRLESLPYFQLNKPQSVNKAIPIDSHSSTPLKSKDPLAGNLHKLFYEILAIKSNAVHKKEAILCLIIREIASYDIETGINLVNKHIVSRRTKENIIISLATKLFDKNPEAAWNLYEQIDLKECRLSGVGKFFRQAEQAKDSRVFSKLQSIWKSWFKEDALALMGIEFLQKQRLVIELHTMARMMLAKDSDFRRGIRLSDEIVMKILVLCRENMPQGDENLFTDVEKFKEKYDDEIFPVIMALKDLDEGFSKIEELYKDNNSYKRLSLFIMIAQMAKIIPGFKDKEKAVKRAEQEVKTFLEERSRIFESGIYPYLINFLLDGKEELMKLAYEKCDASKKVYFLRALAILKNETKLQYEKWIQECYQNLSDDECVQIFSVVYPFFEENFKQEEIERLLGLMKVTKSRFRTPFEDSAVFLELVKMNYETFKEILKSECAELKGSEFDFYEYMEF